MSEMKFRTQKCELLLLLLRRWEKGSRNSLLAPIKTEGLRFNIFTGREEREEEGKRRRQNVRRRAKGFEISALIQNPYKDVPFTKEPEGKFY